MDFPECYFQIRSAVFLTQESIDKMLAAGIYVVPTFAALHNILANADNNDGPKIPDFMIEKCLQVTEAHKVSMKLFYEAGGKIAVGTDAGTPHNRHGNNAEELSFMCANGIGQIDAMRISSFNAADLMGLDNHGLIAVNYAADIVQVNGDPSDDIEMVVNPKTTKR